MTASMGGQSKGTLILGTESHLHVHACLVAIGKDWQRVQGMLASVGKGSINQQVAKWLYTGTCTLGRKSTV